MKRFAYTVIGILGLWFAVALGGCDEAALPRPEKLPMVVEGWIEEGETPVVIVTHAVDLTADSASFDDIVEKWGRVSIFDGDERVILTGHLNKDYTPSFIFTTSRIKGKPGHTYRLLIETETDTVEAESAIAPSGPSITSLKAELVEGSDSLYLIRAFVSGLEADGYYKFFVKSEGNETRYFGSFLGNFRGSDYDAERGYVITKGKHSAYSGETTDHYFHPGETVSVRLCSMEGNLYDFWKSYDEQVSLSDNLFFNFTSTQPTNIAGGRGYWAAYTASTRAIYIP